MSFDLMVFDPDHAPRERAAFMEWFRDITRWEDKLTVDIPDGLSGNLPAFYRQITKSFPDINGPEARAYFDFVQPPPPGFFARLFGAKPVSRPELDESRLVECTFHANAIYLSFTSSLNGDAGFTCSDVANDTGVGLFNVSAGNGQIFYDRNDFETIMGL